MCGLHYISFGQNWSRPLVSKPFDMNPHWEKIDHAPNIYVFMFIYRLHTCIII